MAEKKAPWRETPLDHWSAEIDPSIMASDIWVDKGDPGAEKAVTEQSLAGAQTNMTVDRFMHPQYDVEGKD
ncbi:DUF3905 domain-containing protein [Sulfoacidibacillus thermotolerans]|uniref:Uncharacterized protein n=1 Tax=Sulfoacidibacillus thermotolerans TaxID=1765684 RepID=A0A2U3D9F8_SULT2|nr:DUF3905 domain-containing protein [Sulfoacidibacillus thermotolerans]PWI57919.1 hypothetical protein BM613_05745 [Sulfoacidibacillus thermotolerans]